MPKVILKMSEKWSEFFSLDIVWEIWWPILESKMLTELIKWNSPFKLKGHFEKLLVIEKLDLWF